MELSLTPDAAGTFKALAVRRPGGVVAQLEVSRGEDETYGELALSLAGALTERSPWGLRPWEVLLVAERDHPLNRAIGFWRRYGDKLAGGADGIEATRTEDG